MKNYSTDKKIYKEIPIKVLSRRLLRNFYAIPVTTLDLSAKHTPNIEEAYKVLDGFSKQDIKDLIIRALSSSIQHFMLTEDGSIKSVKTIEEISKSLELDTEEEKLELTNGIVMAMQTDLAIFALIREKDSLISMLE